MPEFKKETLFLLKKDSFLLKKRLRHRYFPVNFEKFLRKSSSVFLRQVAASDTQKHLINNIVVPVLFSHSINLIMSDVYKW